MQKNHIKPEDIYSRKDYSNKRPQLRKEIVARKKKRVDIGPYVTLYFENRDTIIHQINEMVLLKMEAKNKFRRKFQLTNP